MKKFAEKEFKRVKEAMKTISVEKNLENKQKKLAGDIMELIESYYIDATHFYKQEKWLECFEICVYIFGLFDCAARLKFINPGKARKHFKVEQD